MAYADQTALEARLPKRGSDASAFLPLTTTQVDDILDGISDDLDGRLAQLGIGVPVLLADHPTLYAYLSRLCVWGSAAEVTRARFHDGSGPSAEAAWAFFEDRYQKGLANLADIALGVVGRPSALRPASYTQQHPDEDNDLGANAEPVLTTTMEW